MLTFLPSEESMLICAFGTRQNIRSASQRAYEENTEYIVSSLAQANSQLAIRATYACRGCGIPTPRPG